MSEEYTVSVSCQFDADSPEDAVTQMVLWIEEAARHAGYRWTSESYAIKEPFSEVLTGGYDYNETGFIDADSIDELLSFGPVDIVGYHEQADEHAISLVCQEEE